MASYGGLELPTNSEFESSVAAADLSWDHSGEQGLVSSSTREQMTEDNRDELEGQGSDEPLYEDVHVDVEIATAGEPIYDLVHVEEGASAGEIELSEYARSGSQAGNGEEGETAETAV